MLRHGQIIDSAVVPYVGTWIEMSVADPFNTDYGVVPYVGTWIEIYFFGGICPRLICRSLRGNVDRNSNIGCRIVSHKVVPYVGTWIEIQAHPDDGDA